MAIQINGMRIERVEIVDDDISARLMMADNVTDADLLPIDVGGPIHDLENFVRLSKERADAAICDHKLGLIGNYSRYNGAESVASLYDSGYPAILCTNFAVPDIDSIRKHLRRIPSLIKTDDIDPETLVNGLILCAREVRGDFVPHRKPWRTLVRVEEINEGSSSTMLYVALPGWGSNERIRIPLDILPAGERSKISVGLRFHALVNIGAENTNQLYFTNFEFD